MTYLRSLPDADFKAVLKAYPEIGRPFALYHDAVMRGPSPLSPGDRELIAAYVSGLNRCDFCSSEHTGVAEAFGVAAGLVQSLLDDVESAPVADALKPILHFVRKLTLTPNRLTPADAEAVFAAGWDDTALYHAVSVCAMFNLDNRLVQGLGLPPPGPQDLRDTVKRLHDHGYASTARYIDGDWPPEGR